MSAPAPATDRRLDTLDAAAVFVGIILGSGIFVTPSEVAGAAPALPLALALWAGGAVVALCGASTYAECASRLPSNGGFFLYYRAVYGDAVAFAGGWAAQLVTYPASTAAIAVLGATYLAPLVGLGEGASAGLASALVVGSAALHVVGLRAGAWAQRVLTGVKVGAVALVCVAALASGHVSQEVAAPVAWPGLAVLVPAFMGILWAYDGWSDVTLLAGELRSPGRQLGRAVVVGVAVLAAVYALVQVSVVRLLGAGGAAHEAGVFAAAAQAGLGDRGARLVSALVVVSTFGSVNGVLFAASRLGQAMSREGAFFAYFAESHPKRGTPVRSIALLTAACLVYVWVSDFRGLLSFFGQVIWTFYGLTAVALLVLRRRGVGDAIAWRSPVGGLAPWGLLAASLGMTALLAWESPARFAIGLGLTAIAIPIHWVWRRFHSAPA